MTTATKERFDADLPNVLDLDTRGTEVVDMGRSRDAVSYLLSVSVTFLLDVLFVGGVFKLAFGSKILVGVD